MAERDNLTGTTPYFDPAGTLTQDEYQKRFIDYYEFGGIKPAKVLEVDEEKKEEVKPNVLMAVGSEDERTNIFGTGIAIQGKSFTFEPYSATKALADYSSREKTAQDRTGGDKVKGFTDYIKSDEGILGGTLGVMGLPAVGPIMAAAGYKNRENQKKTADAILATDNTGGAMFKLNGQVVYRAPGSTQYNGTYQGPSSQILGMEAIRNGFLPGTFREVPETQPFQTSVPTNRYVKTGLAVAHADTDAMVVINANGNTVGSDGTMGGVTASQATAARESHARKLAAGTGYTPTAADALEIRQKGLAHMRATFNIGAFDRSSDLSAEESAARAKEYNRYTSALMKEIIERQTKISDDFSTGELGTDIGVGSEVPQGSSRPLGPDFVEGESLGQSPEKPEIGSGPPNPNLSPEKPEKTMDTSGATAPGPGFGGINPGFSGGYRASGGRVGLQEGGVAGAQAGFVERPPSQVSEAATVADDKPMSVPEGTFVINAAAVEFAGEKDIIDMLNAAYKEAEKKGIQPPSEEMLEVAVSRGEVIVPPFLAKIIGYDRLEKINNRGKKEVNERIKENGQRPVEAAGGGFLARKKLANGGEVDEYEDKIIVGEVRRKMKELLGSLPEDVTVTSKYFGDERPARREYYEELARLTETKPLQGKFFSSDRQKLINAPRTPTLLNLYILAEEVAHQLGNTTKQRPLGLFSSSEKEKQEYMESRYAEELRAKKIAFDAVGGLFPTDKRAVDLYEGTHANSFANFILKTGSPEFFQQMVKKYPKLKGQFNDDGTVKKQTKPSQNFLIAVQEEEARIKDAFKDSTFIQRMNPFTDTPVFREGYTGPEGNPSK